MPRGFPTHKPPKSAVPDALVRQQDRARHAARALPYSGRQWQAIRKAVLEREPLCRECGAPATDVDHIDGNNANNAFSNLQPLCHADHSRKTRREMNARERAA